MGFCFCSISANSKWPSLSRLSCPPACSLVSAVNLPPRPPHAPPFLSTEPPIVSLLSDSAPLAFPYPPQWTRKGRDAVGLQSSHLGVFFLYREGSVYFVASPTPQYIRTNPQHNRKMATYLQNAFDSFFFLSHSVGVRPRWAGLTPGQSALCLCFSLSHLCVLFWGGRAATARLQPGGFEAGEGRA